MKIILSILFIELFFNISFFITGGGVLDTKLKFHKYEKENFKEIKEKALKDPILLDPRIKQEKIALAQLAKQLNVKINKSNAIKGSHGRILNT